MLHYLRRMSPAFVLFAYIIAPILARGANPVDFQPQSLDFGSVALLTSLQLTITLTNNNASAVQVDTVYIDQGNAAIDYSIKTNGGLSFVLGSGQSATVTIVFAPSTLGARTALLEVFTSNGRTAANLVGTGSEDQPTVVVAPQSIELGSVALGSVLDTVFDVINTGIDSAAISDLLVTNLNGSNEFNAALADNTLKFPVLLAPGDTLRIAVTFAAEDPLGAREATVEVLGDLTGSTVCTLDAASAEPHMMLSTVLIDFDTVYQGAVVDTTATIYSRNGVGLIIDDLEQPGNGFSILNPPVVPFTIPGKDSLVLHIRLNPFDTGKISGTIGIHATQNDSGGEFRAIELFAYVKEVPLVLSKLSSISYYCGLDTALSFLVTLTDTTNAPVIISGIASSDTALSLAAPISFPFTLGAGDTLSIPLRFLRLNDSAYTAHLEIMGGEVPIRIDTISVTSRSTTAILRTSQVLSANGMTVNHQVFAGQDLTAFDLSSLDILVACDNPDGGTIEPATFAVNTGAFPGATLQYLLLPDQKTYDVTLAFPAGLSYSGMNFNSTWLLQYTISTQVSRDTNTLVTVGAISRQESGCLDFVTDSISLQNQNACGDPILRTVLNSQPLILSSAMHPDPVSGASSALSFNLSQSALVDYVIVNLEGAEVRRERAIQMEIGSNLFTLDLSTLQSGTYFLKVVASSQNRVEESSMIRFAVTR